MTGTKKNVITFFGGFSLFVCSSAAIFFLVLILRIHEQLNLNFYFLFTDHFDTKVINIIVFILFAASALGAVFSALLLFGVTKGIPGLIVPYFSLGTLTALIMAISSVLFLLSKHYYQAFVVLTVSLLLLSFVCEIYDHYETLLNKIDSNIEVFNEVDFPPDGSQQISESYERFLIENEMITNDDVPLLEDETTVSFSG